MAAERVEPDVDQERFLAACAQLGKAPSPAVLGVGGPGTGKTTILLDAMVASVTSGLPLDRIVMLTWSRAAAQALRRRLVARLGASQLGVRILTVHGWCLALQRRFGARPGAQLPRLLTAPEQEFRLRDLLAGFGPDRWPANLTGALGTVGFARQVRTALARARQLGLDPVDVVRAGEESGRLEWVSLGHFFEEYLTVLDAEGALDYAELVHRTRMLLLDEQVAAGLPSDTAVILCDEFAELDPAQLSLLADAHAAGCGVAAVADPWTAAFSFRGADQRVVGDFQEAFNIPGGPAPLVLPLRVAHRGSPYLWSAWRNVATRLPQPSGGSPAAVLEPWSAGRAPAEDMVCRTTGHLAAVGDPTHREGMVIEPASADRRWPAPAVAVHVYETPQAEAAGIAAWLHDAHLMDGVEWPDCAVITRSGHGEIGRVARALADQGIPVEVAGDEIPLREQAAVRTLLDGLRAALEIAEKGGPEPDLALDVLQSPLGGADALEVRALGRSLSAAGRSTRSSLGEVLAGMLGDAEETSLRLDELACDSGVATGDSGVTRATECLQVLGQTLKLAAQQIRGDADVGTVLWTLWSRAGVTSAEVGWAERLRASALADGLNAAGANRDLDAVMALFDQAARLSELAGARGVRALLLQVASQQIPADHARESTVRGLGVRVLTAHRAKGLCWRVVVLAGVQEGSWPVLRPRDSLLDFGPAGERTRRIRDAVQGDRRLFLLAASRASDRLLVTASQADEDAGAPSRFLSQLGVPVQPAPEPGTGGRTLPGLVARLRRAGVDPELSRPLHWAAGCELGGLARERDPDGRALAPWADPDRWWGLRGLTPDAQTVASPAAPLHLSVTELRDLLECPRKWFLTRRVHARPASSSSAAFGNLLHRIIELLQHATEEPDELADALDRVWPRIPFEAAWLAESERIAADAAVEAFRRWQTRFAGDLLGTEVEFAQSIEVAPGQSVLLTGIVDRLERDASGRLRVIDFKTSRTAVKAAEASADIQLGCYQLVAQQGAFDSLTGGSRALAGATLVYVRVQDRNGLPTVRQQSSLDDVAYLPDDPREGQYPTWVHAQLVSAVQTIRAGRLTAQPGPHCRWCAFQHGCPSYRR